MKNIIKPVITFLLVVVVSVSTWSQPISQDSIQLLRSEIHRKETIVQKNWTAIDSLTRLIRDATAKFQELQETNDSLINKNVEQAFLTAPKATDIDTAVFQQLYERLSEHILNIGEESWINKKKMGTRQAEHRPTIELMWTLKQTPTTKEVYTCALRPKIDPDVTTVGDILFQSIKMWKLNPDYTEPTWEITAAKTTFLFNAWFGEYNPATGKWRFYWNPANSNCCDPLFTDPISHHVYSQTLFLWADHVFGPNWRTCDTN